MVHRRAQIFRGKCQREEKGEKGVKEGERGQREKGVRSLLFMREDGSGAGRMVRRYGRPKRLDSSGWKAPRAAVGDPKKAPDPFSP